MASKRAASISDLLSEAELAFFQSEMAGPEGAQLEPTDDDEPVARRGFWSRLLGRWRR